VIVRTLVVLLAVSLAAGCGAPNRLIRVSPANASITGIASVLKTSGTVDVVLVHGMCNHDKRWVVATNAELAKYLSVTSITTNGPKAIGDDGGELYISELEGELGKIRTFSILWAPVTAKAKLRLCYDMTEVNDVCKDPAVLLRDERVWANGYLKNTILDECLADAVYYVGAEGGEKVGRTIRDGLERALSGGRLDGSSPRASLSAFREQSAPLFIVAQSLGSKMLLDALIEMAKEDCDRFANVAFAVGRTRQVFMEANQLPILALAHDPVLPDRCLRTSGSPGADTSSGGATGLAALARLYRASDKGRDGFSDPIKVAAFSDSNDLLSYTLGPATDPKSGYEVVDIVTSNDWSYLGIVENPYAAHTTYGRNKLVQRVIACGSDGLNGSCVDSRD